MYKNLLLFLLVLLSVTNTLRGESVKDSLFHEKKWFVPDAAVLQYAGNMGLLAAGPSYNLINKQLQIDVLYGYVPKFQGAKAGHLITLKTTYKPFALNLDSKYTLTPLQAGLGISYHFGSQYSIVWEEPYPKGYYWWSTRLRLLGFAGASINRKLTDSFAKDVGVYAELGTYELLVTAWYKDEKLRLWDIMSASVGVRVKF